MINRTTATMALVVGSAVALASCSSSSSKPGVGSGTQAGTGAKSDIRVMVVALLSGSVAAGGITFPFAPNGAKAAATAINKAGGIDGHQVKVDICDSKGDPNQSATCARTAKSNGDVALVGTFDPLGAPQILTVLQAAGIPYIGGIPVTPAELTSPVSFPIDPGAQLAAFALAQLFVDSGCKKVVTIGVQGPGSEQTAKGQGAVLTKAGVEYTNLSQSVSSVDIAPLVSQALAKSPDCINYNGDGGITVKFINAFRKAGYTGRFAESVVSLSPPYVASLGAAANGILVPSPTLPQGDPDPMTAQFATDLSAQLGGDPAKIGMNSNEFAQSAWSSVQIVKQALTGNGTYTAAALLKKLPTMCDVNPGNFYPHINFCKPSSSKLYPRVYNDYWQYFKIQDGKYVASDSKWHDESATIPQ